MTIALYPGTFDPIHNGHIDIATRAAGLFEHVIVGLYDRPAKRLLFSADERAQMARLALAHLPNVTVQLYSSLTVDFAGQIGASVVVRGLRAISDFEFEFQLALTNKKLAPGVETVGLMSSLEYLFLSSTILKEVALLNGPVSDLVPPHVEAALQQKAAT
ncbi:MAG: pantetheine-phosphate adenylyltransferase [Anaerolineae bacterium]|uniref:pantetheine-phosphate adenylyltransferase n=1 Tax=Candidatus Amarolinea dominans TaxID=3140696 RepID=UPI001DE7C616|nr:pantetheine-phosphate adenylyltransferase [Anaerolineae bacterium]MBK7201541.1 pantetheine-phosphate adenylyltransferase [Anaerolineae bacterium]MBK9092544.1 pantetheine-phosphate adenylyltransferase [Anaerolineae bacterium]MBK9231532.1 pantetheine-phosphate adenylyltransferase [Anaerolineae bacterium]